MKRIALSLLGLTILLAFQNCGKWQGGLEVTQLSQDGNKLSAEVTNDDTLDTNIVDIPPTTSLPTQDSQVSNPTSSLPDSAPPITESTADSTNSQPTRSDESSMPTDTNNSEANIPTTTTPGDTAQEGSTPDPTTGPTPDKEIVLEEVDPDDVDQATCDKLVAHARTLRNIASTSIQNAIILSRGKVHILAHDLDHIENVIAGSKFVVVGSTTEGERRVKINSISSFIGRGVFCNLDIGKVDNLIGYIRLYTGNVDSLEDCIGNIKVSNGQIFNDSKADLGIFNTCRVHVNN